MIKKIFFCTTLCLGLGILRTDGAPKADPAPDFLIIGVTKCGTTSLYDYMCQHPQIVSARNKETHFFDRYFSRGIGWYKKQFPQVDPGFLTGEATPTYFWRKGCPQKVLANYPNAKFILILRNPVNRIISNYYFRKSRGEERKSFKEAVFCNNPKGGYLRAGRYSEHLEKWLSLSPNNPPLILFLEELAENPEKEVNKVFAFLGLKEHKLNAYKIRNKTRYDANEIDSEVIARLKKYYEPYNKQLEQFLGRDLPWSK